MQKHRVSFRPLAVADLEALYETILADSGPEVAGGYVDRIEAACVALASFPKRGTPRDDLFPGLRTLGFERRVTIAFRIVKAEVVVVRIFYGGRDIEGALRGSTDA